MKKRSRRRRRGRPAPPRSAGSLGGGADRISALGDDLLRLILARLGCAATAARAGLLSRRWRGLWTRLPALVFRDVSFPSLGPALASLISSSSSSDALSLLDIHLPQRAVSTCSYDGISSLLRAAARLSPGQLVLALPCGTTAMYASVELPCFTRATSISLSAAEPIILRLPSDPAAAGVEFPALTTLALTHYMVDDLHALVLHCPCLRLLRVVNPGSSFIGMPLDITVHSASLRELVLDGFTLASGRIDISTPVLEQLTVSARHDHEDDLSISVVAPKVENVSWRCRYGGGPLGFGPWTLDAMSLLSTTTARPSSTTLLRVHVSQERFGHLNKKQDYAAREIEKHLQLQVAAESSVLALELHLATLDHIYKALVFFFLEMQPIRTAIQSLKVTMPQPTKTHYLGKIECKVYCSGCVPKGWASQTILLMELQEVEIDGFEGADHEFDFLEHLFSCAPMLKRVTLKQLGETAPSDDTKRHNFFRAHPFVECYYVLSSNTASIAPSLMPCEF